MMKYLCACFGVLVGCGASADVGITETTAADLRPIKVVATEPAIADITRAECARAQACGAVVSRGIYRDADYCETNIDRAVRDELRTDRCAYIDRAGIAKCLDTISRESCADLNFTEHVPTACRRAALCRRVAVTRVGVARLGTRRRAGVRDRRCRPSRRHRRGSPLRP